MFSGLDELILLDDTQKSKLYSNLYIRMDIFKYLFWWELWGRGTAVNLRRLVDLNVPSASQDFNFRKNAAKTLKQSIS